MKVEQLKTKIKVIFPEECEIFSVEESKNELITIFDSGEYKEKLVEIDLSKVESIDTTFFQLILSFIKTLKNEEVKYKVKSVSERVQQVFELYGVKLDIFLGGYDG
ncbi:conserved hypothetical protein [Deferribacter desulfuricans SSM1]|uniref:STAS domain-containing protein n=1 Tax=Deferribacter desulfuricans (strain DSM 14783 / JCM 11476 / NBRC 101012 / SSM1) TaxID=639282 RepID=D3PDJ4_DEFDS|nr:STAS domain-containing protein [Deferribacter desulfuricans]BAI80667.1 conserved hypothetical protein [Deferribacter desulfuricans SSM1]